MLNDYQYGMFCLLVMLLNEMLHSPYFYLLLILLIFLLFSLVS